MNRSSLLLLALCGLFAAARTHAAESPAVSAAGDDGTRGGPAVAVDQDFVAPVEALSPQQVAALQQRLRDWAGLARYRADNAALPAPDPARPRVVFYGDSITEGWNRGDVPFFPGRPYLDRGISGQTTAQMLVRFRQDVIDLHPAVVVVLAGTNDLAGNTGFATLASIEDNLASMTQLAQANGIRVVLASVLPVAAYPWRPGVRPARDVETLNRWIEAYARDHDAIWLDYHAPLANARGGMDARHAADGVHPTPAGYALMAPLAEAAIARALGR